MITCRDVIAALDDLLAGALALEQGERIEQHLAGCRSCAAYRETYRLTIEAARQLPVAPLPSGLGERVWATLKENCTQHE
jgi:hypothetical protein